MINCFLFIYNIDTSTLTDIVSNDQINIAKSQNAASTVNQKSLILIILKHLEQLYLGIIVVADASLSLQKILLKEVKFSQLYFSQMINQLNGK